MATRSSSVHVDVAEGVGLAAHEVEGAEDAMLGREGDGTTADRMPSIAGWSGELRHVLGQPERSRRVAGAARRGTVSPRSSSVRPARTARRDRRGEMTRSMRPVDGQEQAVTIERQQPGAARRRPLPTTSSRSRLAAVRRAISLRSCVSSLAACWLSNERGVLDGHGGGVADGRGGVELGLREGALGAALARARRCR